MANQRHDYTTFERTQRVWPIGELIFDTDQNALYQGDNLTFGGIRITRDEDVQSAVDAAAGYYARLTNYYFTGGVATETEVSSDDLNIWITPNFTMEPGLGLFDYRPQAMVDADADPFDAATNTFSLEGLTIKSNVVFRASLSFEPDEDGGQVDARLLFTRHSGTTPDTQFPIEDVALTMTQGADVDYPGEPSLTFFVGDTIDTNGPGDAGSCQFQIRTTVPGTLRMRALTWYITQ